MAATIPTAINRPPALWALAAPVKGVVPFPAGFGVVPVGRGAGTGATGVLVGTEPVTVMTEVM